VKLRKNIRRGLTRPLLCWKEIYWGKDYLLNEILCITAHRYSTVAAKIRATQPCLVNSE